MSKLSRAKPLGTAQNPSHNTASSPGEGDGPDDDSVALAVTVTAEGIEIECPHMSAAARVKVAVFLDSIARLTGTPSRVFPRARWSEQRQSEDRAQLVQLLAGVHRRQCERRGDDSQWGDTDGRA